MISRRHRFVRCLLLLTVLLFSTASVAVSIDDLVARAAIAEGEKKYDQAHQLLSAALARQPDDEKQSQILRFRARTSELARKKEAAEADYSAAIKLTPNDSRTYRDRGYFYFYQNKLEQALADFEIGSKLAPQDGEVLNGKGLVLAKQHKYDEAILVYDRALSIDPGSSEYRIGKAEAYNLSERWKRALEEYDKAAGLGNLTQRNTVRLKAGRGHANLKLGQHDEAIKDFDTVLELNPRHVRVLEWRGLSHENLGNKSAALQDYESALAQNSSEEWVAKRARALREYK